VNEIVLSALHWPKMIANKVFSNVVLKVSKFLNRRQKKSKAPWSQWTNPNCAFGSCLKHRRLADRDVCPQCRQRHLSNMF